MDSPYASSRIRQPIVISTGEPFAGDDLPDMLQSKVACEAFVQHPSAHRRLAAVLLLTHYWPHDNATRNQLQAVAFADPDSEVRAISTSNLGTLYYQTRGQASPEE